VPNLDVYGNREIARAIGRGISHAAPENVAIEQIRNTLAPPRFMIARPSLWPSGSHRIGVDKPNRIVACDWHALCVIGMPCVR